MIARSRAAYISRRSTASGTIRGRFAAALIPNSRAVTGYYLNRMEIADLHLSKSRWKIRSQVDTRKERFY